MAAALVLLIMIPLAAETQRALDYVPGPQELLMSKNEPRRVKNLARRRRDPAPSKSDVPDYLLRLRERHAKEWMNFGQAEGGNGPNLGIITTIRHHWHLGKYNLNNLPYTRFTFRGYFVFGIIFSA